MKKTKSDSDEGFLATMRKRVERAWDIEKDNIAGAYDDLEFAAGNQWPVELRREREGEGRPCLTINQVLTFCRQVTGDMRQSRPAIKVYGVDDKADRKTAEAFNEVIRYIEGRSDAKEAYFRAIESQVIAGIGHIRILTEPRYFGSDEQEIRISPVEDGVAVLWDHDAVLPGKADAKWCFVPVDYEYDTLKAKYPGADISSFSTMQDMLTTYGPDSSYWHSADKVRIGEYFVVEAGGGKAPPKVRRYVVSYSEVLEGPQDVPGYRIPVVPVVGEEIRIGQRLTRFGKVRHLRPVQLAYNYWMSAQTEVIALQPKTPYIGTDKNFERHPEWFEANRRNLPFLAYTPDPANGGQRPQRETPPVASQAFETAIQRARDDMRAVSGIYDAALGNRSNETSGTAIRARQQEGDTGTFVYMSNFTMALQQLGRVLVGMIPVIYDTTRVLRITGEDGAVNEVQVMRPVGAIVPPDGAEPVQIFENDFSVGQYDVTVEAGPSYTTKRAEARDGMMQLLQTAPAAGNLILDLIVKAQDWPMADKIAERFRFALPDQIKQAEAQEAGGNGQPMVPSQPDPAQIMQMKAQQESMQMDLAAKQAETDGKMAQAEKARAEAEKAKIELEKARGELAMMVQPSAADPRMDQVIMAVQQLAEQVSGIVEVLNAPPMPDDDMAMQGFVPAS